MKQDIEFKSKGVTLRGWLITPDTGEGPFPTVVMAGGWCYVREIVMPHYAKFMHEKGIATIIFDYRGFGASEGTPRQHVNPWGQIEDYRNAISFALTRPEVDPDRIGVWGISLSGGHAIVLSGIESRIKASVSIIPSVDGYSGSLRNHDTQGLRRLKALIAEDRESRFKSGEYGYMAMSTRRPHEEASVFPFPETYEIFNAIKDSEAPLHEHWNTIASLELWWQYDVFPFAKRNDDTPICVILTSGDDLTPFDQQVAAFNHIATSKKKLVSVPNTTHMKLYSDLSHLQVVGETGADFFEEHLIKAFETTK